MLYKTYATDLNLHKTRLSHIKKAGATFGYSFQNDELVSVLASYEKQ